MLLLFILCLNSWATGSAPAMVSVRTGQDAVEYVTLPSGTQLNYDTPGPAKVVIESRRRMAGPSQRSRPAPLEALGDNNIILTMQVPGSAIANGQIDDSLGGVPSKVERSVVTVPPGGRMLSLRAPVGGPDFLVRVYRRSGEPIIPSGLRVPEPKGVPPVGTPQPKPAPLLVTQPSPDPSSPGLVQAIGLGFGLGIPGRGAGMVLHGNIVGRAPVYSDLLSVGGSVGFHRIAVNDSHTIDVPYGGYATQTVSYSTAVIPMEAHVGVHLPLGTAHSVTTVGIAVSIASRHQDGADRVTNLAIGPTIGTGLEYALGPGLTRALVEWTDSRTRFGNADAQGTATRETLAVTRFSVQYLFPF